MRKHVSLADAEWVYNDRLHNDRRREILGEIACEGVGVGLRSGMLKTDADIPALYHQGLVGMAQARSA